MYRSRYYSPCCCCWRSWWLSCWCLCPGGRAGLRLLHALRLRAVDGVRMADLPFTVLVGCWCAALVSSTCCWVGFLPMLRPWAHGASRQPRVVGWGRVGGGPWRGVGGAGEGQADGLLLSAVLGGLGSYTHCLCPPHPLCPALAPRAGWLAVALPSPPHLPPPPPPTPTHTRTCAVHVHPHPHPHPRPLQADFLPDTHILFDHAMAPRAITLTIVEAPSEFAVPVKQDRCAAGHGCVRSCRMCVSVHGVCMGGGTRRDDVGPVAR